MEPEAHEPTTVSQRLMDIFVFAPAGLVVTAVEEFPRLVERGRERVTGRVTSARTVGSFAVSAGRHRLRQRADDLRHDRESAGAPVPDEPDSPATAVPTEGPTAATLPDGPVVRAASTPSRSASPENADDGMAPSVDSAPAVDGAPAPLAIPGFDTLSASQVVQRLDGLTPDELAAVRAHESAHRGRRTILNRVEQLLDERS